MLCFNKSHPLSCYKRLQVHQMLKANFADSWIGRGKGIHWSSWSSDLTLLFLKDIVYAMKAPHMDVLRNRIDNIIDIKLTIYLNSFSVKWNTGPIYFVPLKAHMWKFNSFSLDTFQFWFQKYGFVFLYHFSFQNTRDSSYTLWVYPNKRHYTKFNNKRCFHITKQRQEIDYYLPSLG